MSHRGDQATARSSSFGVVDALVLVATVGALAAAWLLQAAWVPAMTDAFQSFGGTLPRVTRAAITPMISLTGTALAAILAGVGVTLRALGRRRSGLVLLVLACLCALATPVALVAAVYDGISAVSEAVSEAVR